MVNMGLSWYGVLGLVQLISSTIVYASDPCAQIDHYVTLGKKQGTCALIQYDWFLQVMIDTLQGGIKSPGSQAIWHMIVFGRCHFAQIWR